MLKDYIVEKAVMFSGSGRNGKPITLPPLNLTINETGNITAFVPSSDINWQNAFLFSVFTLMVIGSASMTKKNMRKIEKIKRKLKKTIKSAERKT